MRTCAFLIVLSACSSSPMMVMDAGMDASDVDSAVDARGPTTSWCDGGVRPGDEVVCDNTETSTVVVTGPSGPFNVIYTASTTRLHVCSPLRIRLCAELVETLEGSVQRTECTDSIVLNDNAQVQCGTRHTQYAPDGITIVRDDTSTWTRIAIEWL